MHKLKFFRHSAMVEINLRNYKKELQPCTVNGMKNCVQDASFPDFVE